MEEFTEDMIQELGAFSQDTREQVQSNSNDNEAYDYFILANSNGWKRLEEYLISQRDFLIESTKIKNPSEDLASYGAKRLAVDSTVDFVNGIMSYVKVNAELYDQNK